MPIHFEAVHNWDEYRRFLRQFQLDDLLKKVNLESYSFWPKGTHDLCIGLRQVQYAVLDPKTKTMKTFSSFCSAWGLIDTAYHAILATNDFRGSEVHNRNDLYAICALDGNYHSEAEKAIVDQIGKSPDMLSYVMGMSGEQSKFQNPGLVFENAARDMYILFEIGEKNYGLPVSEIVLQDTGVTWDFLCISFLLAWKCFAQMSTLQEIADRVKWKDEAYKESFIRVIRQYTVTYDDVRKGKLGRQVFYTKPYVMTQRKEIISINEFLNLFAYEHCLLWTVRNHYQKDNDQYFVNLFGMMFEDYVKELFETYLRPDQYERIPESRNGKRADWRVFIAGYSFLIEQKSSILRLSAKQQLSDYGAVKQYLKKTVLEAITQLDDTEQEYQDREYIKVVLLYEDYLGDGVVKDILTAGGNIERDASSYWFVTIGELERLLHLISTSPMHGAEVIRKKHDIDRQHALNQRRLAGWLNDYDDGENSCLRDGQFAKFNGTKMDLIQKYLY